MITVFRPSIARAASVWTDRARNCTSQFGHGTVTPLSSSLSVFDFCGFFILFSFDFCVRVCGHFLIRLCYKHTCMGHWRTCGIGTVNISCHKHGMNEHFVSQSSNFCLPCLTVVKFVRRSFIDVSCTPIGVSDFSPP